jgi:hypothetical protein
MYGREEGNNLTQVYRVFRYSGTLGRPFGATDCPSFFQTFKPTATRKFFSSAFVTK